MREPKNDNVFFGACATIWLYVIKENTVHYCQRGKYECRL